jgi:hypothetical protein
MKAGGIAAEDDDASRVFHAAEGFERMGCHIRSFCRGVGLSGQGKYHTGPGEVKSRPAIQKKGIGLKFGLEKCL